MSSNGTRYLVGFCVIAGLLLAGTAAQSIKKKPRPQPAGQPETVVEQRPGLPVGEMSARAEPGVQEKAESPASSSTAADPVADEERKHLRRVARINRIQVLGIETEKRRLVDLARELRDKETRRHELAMQRLAAALETGGGR